MQRERTRRSQRSRAARRREWGTGDFFRVAPPAPGKAPRPHDRHGGHLAAHRLVDRPARARASRAYVMRMVARPAGHRRVNRPRICVTLNRGAPIRRQCAPRLPIRAELAGPPRAALSDDYARSMGSDTYPAGRQDFRPGICIVHRAMGLAPSNACVPDPGRAPQASGLSERVWGQVGGQVREQGVALATSGPMFSPPAARRDHMESRRRRISETWPSETRLSARPKQQVFGLRSSALSPSPSWARPAPVFRPRKGS